MLGSATGCQQPLFLVRVVAREVAGSQGGCLREAPSEKGLPLRGCPQPLLSENTYEHAFNKFWELNKSGFWDNEIRKRKIDNKSWVKFVNSKIGADIDAVISCFNVKRWLIY